MSTPAARQLNFGLLTARQVILQQLALHSTAMAFWTRLMCVRISSGPAVCCEQVLAL